MAQYSTIFAISQDPYMRRRIAACVALLGVELNAPEEWVEHNRWRLATTDGWADLWDAKLAGPFESEDAANRYTPGNDSDLITDEMILAAVEAIAADPEAGV